MSLITIEQFDEFVEEFPEMEQFYDFRYDSDTKDAFEDEDDDEWDDDPWDNFELDWETHA